MMNKPISRSALDNDGAKRNKERFVKLVRCLAALRDVQYDQNMAEGLVLAAKQVVAGNLPSNSLRAAAIFVDYRYGFPPFWCAFMQPAWATAKKLLPEGERGCLACAGLDELADVEVGSSVVLTRDVPEDGLHGGMAGVVRQVDSEDFVTGNLVVEFGEPEDCISLAAKVPIAWLRCPRPGDLIEHYRRLE